MAFVPVLKIGEQGTRVFEQERARGIGTLTGTLLGQRDDGFRTWRNAVKRHRDAVHREELHPKCSRRLRTLPEEGEVRSGMLPPRPGFVGIRPEVFIAIPLPEASARCRWPTLRHGDRWPPEAARLAGMMR